MSKYIKCEQCNVSLGEIKEGSKLRKDVVYLCRICYNKSGKKTQKNDMPDFFADLFKGKL